MSTTTSACFVPRIHRVALQVHHVEGDRHRGLETVHDVAERVADQDDVAILIDQRRGVGVVTRSASRLARRPCA